MEKSSVSPSGASGPSRYPGWLPVCTHRRFQGVSGVVPVQASVHPSPQAKDNTSFLPFLAPHDENATLSNDALSSLLAYC